jgi:lipopolysaccharide export system protein LptA
MPVSIERLRLWLLIFAGLLAVVVAAVFGYARWEVRHIRRDLPAKLGISIQRSANGFSISKSVGSRTLFTLNAAKMDQYKGAGQAALRNVSITLYGPDGKPADHIYGDNFAFDPVQDIMRANGEVEIDLQGLVQPGATPAKGADADNNIVHVKTSNLVFNQKTGSAVTTEPIEFHTGASQGSATGASFDAHTGECTMDSDVVLNSSVNSSPLAVHASHARFERATHRLFLVNGVSDYNDTHTTSDQVTILFRPDGSAYRVDMEGHVVSSGNGQTVQSPKALVDLDTMNHPLQAFLSGGVLFTGDDPDRKLHGSANSGLITFGSKSSIRHARLNDAVSVVDQELPPPAPAVPGAQQGKTSARGLPLTTRVVQAAQADIDFVQVAPGRSQAQQILAQGSAQAAASLKIHTVYPNTPPQQTEVHGDQLLVTLNNGVEISTLRGTGHTELISETPDGVKQTSTGDTLHMSFAPSPAHPGGTSGGPSAPRSSAPATKPAGRKSGSAQTMNIESAEQDGNVVFLQQPPPPGTQGAAPRPQAASKNSQKGSSSPTLSGGPVRATAQHAVYSGATQVVTLYGGLRSDSVVVDPRVEQQGGDLSATTIEFEHATGNATATGNVQATYRRENGETPVVNLDGQAPAHVIADRAHLDHAANLTIFYGDGGRNARLWQGGDSILAPVLELSGADRTLNAHGAPGSHGAVNAVLTSSGGASAIAPQPSATAAQQAGKPGRLSVEKVNSSTLLYSDAKSEAQLGGGVVLNDSSGTIRSQTADVFFSPANNPPAPSEASSGAPSEVKTEAHSEAPSDVKSGPASAPAPAGQAKQIDHIIARGQVHLEQPGRVGTGEMLVYTASDGKFVLTGTESAPPHLVDQTRGTVTGTSLIFNNRDDSVIVNGGPSKAVTETRTAK